MGKYSKLAVSFHTFLVPIFLQLSVLWETVLQNQYLYQLLQKQMIHLHQPYETFCFYIPSLHLLYWGTVFLTLLEQMVAGIFYCLNELTGWQVCVRCLPYRTFTNFVSRQVKIETGNTLGGEKLPRYEVSKNNFRFDGTTVS